MPIIPLLHVAFNNYWLLAKHNKSILALFDRTSLLILVRTVTQFLLKTFQKPLKNPDAFGKKRFITPWYASASGVSIMLDFWKILRSYERDDAFVNKTRYSAFLKEPQTITIHWFYLLHNYVVMSTKSK